MAPKKALPKGIKKVTQASRCAKKAAKIQKAVKKAKKDKKALDRIKRAKQAKKVIKKALKKKKAELARWKLWARCPEERKVAFAMGFHPRLGAGSRLQSLKNDLARMILDLL